MPTYAVELRNISKRFGPLLANNQVNFALRTGEIHALLGENGAGKSTLMRILYGLYHADEGEIWVAGQQVAIRSPKDAIRHGIGMVTQHFALATPLTVAENIVLGHAQGVALNRKTIEDQVATVANRFGIELDPAAPVQDLSVGQRQRVEIVKALYRQASVLILDEPTAVLAPQEIEKLFANLKRLQEQSLSVIFISHKLHEVMAITDRVTVMRTGQVSGVVSTAATSQAELARMMVGRMTAAAPKVVAPTQQPVVLSLADVSAVDRKGIPALKKVTLHVHAGEILGIAGVSGNGQVELSEVISGVRPCTGGQICVAGAEITNARPSAVMAAGVGRIPEERNAGIVAELTVAQNIALEHLDDFTNRGVLDRQAMTRHAETLIAQYQIKAGPHDKIRTLSGGNMQKVILARVLERNPKVIVVAQPTRGLDIGATGYVRQKLLEQSQQGAAILLISEDLDEIFQLADRIAVLYEGAIMATVPVAEADMERLGLLMAGARP
jgi:simple sugar transport system ATP-binding protein